MLAGGDLGSSALQGADLAVLLASAAVVILVVVMLVKRGTAMTCPNCSERIERRQPECPRCGSPAAGPS